MKSFKERCEDYGLGDLYSGLAMQVMVEEISYGSDGFLIGSRVRKDTKQKTKEQIQNEILAQELIGRWESGNKKIPHNTLFGHDVYTRWKKS